MKYLCLVPGGEHSHSTEEPALQGVLDGGRVPVPLRHAQPAAGGEGGSGGGAQPGRHHHRHHHQQQHVANYVFTREVLYISGSLFGQGLNISGT